MNVSVSDLFLLYNSPFNSDRQIYYEPPEAGRRVELISASLVEFDDFKTKCKFLARQLRAFVDEDNPTEIDSDYLSESDDLIVYELAALTVGDPPTGKRSAREVKQSLRMVLSPTSHDRFPDFR